MVYLFASTKGKKSASIKIAYASSPANVALCTAGAVITEEGSEWLHHNIPASPINLN